LQKGHIFETSTDGAWMNLFSIDSLSLAATVEQLAPWPVQRLLRNETHHNVDLLHCTQRGEDTEDRPDVRYWTAYDHFMVEREARAVRNAYLYGLIVKAWHSLVERLRRRRMLAPADGVRGS
jgi:hypothetical protein